MDSLCRFSFLTDEQAAPTELKGLSLLDDADRDPIVEAVDYAAAQVGAADPSVAKEICGAGRLGSSTSARSPGPVVLEPRWRVRSARTICGRGSRTD